MIRISDTSSGKEQAEYDPILTLVEAPPTLNAQNDCGVLSVLMIARTDKTQGSEENNLVPWREALRKKENEGTMPGDICRFLKEQGYDVSYHSNIDWARCTVDPLTSFHQWDEKLTHLPPGVWHGFIDKQKMRDSAEYLEKEKLVKKERIGIPEMAHVLRDGKRLIILVGGDHYVVLTGIDDKRVYFNNPAEHRTVTPESQTHEEFLQWMKGPGYFNVDSMDDPEWNEVIIAQRTKPTAIENEMPETIATAQGTIRTAIDRLTLLPCWSNLADCFPCFWSRVRRLKS